jgi:SAM-dependent methyltransferase
VTMSLAYRWKVRLIRGNLSFKVMRRVAHINRRRLGLPVTARDYIQRYAPGKSFVDIGGMWAIDGEHSVQAAQAGATRAVCVDLYKTDEFDRKAATTNGVVQFHYGDASSTATADALGEFDVVWCFGVFYHHPSPFEILLVLRRLCRERLVLETLGVPEFGGVANMSLYIPFLDESQRRFWDTGRAQVRLGITTEFDPTKGYGNNFWAPTPSCMRSLLRTAGFETTGTSTLYGPFRYVYDCVPIPDFVEPRG